MRFKATFFVVSILFAAIGCNPDNNPNEVQIEVLNGQKFDLPIFLAKASKIFIAKNKLIVKDEVSEGMFKVFDYPALKFLYAWGNLGDGPADFDSNQFGGLNSYAEGFYFLDNYKLRKFLIINDQIELDTLTLLSNSRGPINGFCLLNDSTFIAEAFDGQSFEHEQVFYFANEQIGKAFGSYPEIDKTFDNPIQKAMHFLKAGTVNEAQKKFIQFYYNLNRAKIYDFNGNLINEIELDLTSNSKYEELNAQKIIFAEPSSSDRLIYVLEVNQPKGNVVKNPDKFRPHLLVLDWSGEIIARYQFDRPIVSFVVSEEYHKIYAVDLETEFEDPSIIVYDLPVLDLNKENLSLFENEFFETEVTDDWSLTERNIGNENKIYKNDFWGVNTVVLHNTKSKDFPCGGNIKIDICLPNKEMNNDQIFNQVLKGYFTIDDWRNHNFSISKDTIQGVVYDNNKFENPENKFPTGEIVHSKSSVWIWKENNRTVVFSYSACNDYMSFYEEARNIIPTIKVKT